MNEIFTIGYAGFDIDSFISVLKKYKINSLIDVRSQPHSKFYKDFDKASLSETLDKYHICYRNYYKEFGARQSNVRYYPNGYLDFSMYVKSTEFLAGMDRLIKAMPLGFTFVLMCSEKDPITCHRNIMVAKEFYHRGINVSNILSDGSTISQDKIEERLVDIYYPNRDQLSFFDEPLSWDEMVKNAYIMQNEKIGYRLRSEEDDEGDE